MNGDRQYSSRKIWYNLYPNSNFVIKDVNPDGNCQFRSISQAIGISHIILRKLVARYILSVSSDEFDHIITIYREEKRCGEFLGHWNPDKTRNRKELADEISKTGFHFQGDYITLSIISKILKLDFIVLKTAVHPGSALGNRHLEKIETPGNQRFAILDFVMIGNSGHYRTVGYNLNKRPKCTFAIRVFYIIFKFLKEDIKINAPQKPI